MKTYNVKQVAEMLNTNPETVRRWVRSQKLKADKVSKKDGLVITDSDLQRFLKAKPKYMLRYSTGLVGGAVASPAIGIPLLLSGLLGSKIMGYLDEEKQTDLRICAEDIERFLETAIKQQEDSLKQKRATLRQIEQDIQEGEKKLEQLRYLINHRELFSEQSEKKERDEKDDKL